MKNNNSNSVFQDPNEHFRSAIGAAVVDERVLTVDDLTRMFNVSTKTISRWREHGLEGKRIVIGGRTRIGFLESSVNRFARDNPKRVHRGARFGHLSAAERDEIIERARQLVGAGKSPTEIVKQVAEKVGRSAETVRYTIKKFDARHPAQAILAHPTEPPSDELQHQIYRQYLQGVSDEALSRRFSHSAKQIRRWINQARADRIVKLPLDYMHSDEFEKPSLSEEILGPMPQPNRTPRKTHRPAGLPTYLAALYEVPLLSKEQEIHLFRKYNYAKCRASELRERLNPARPRRRDLDEIESLYRQAVDTKNQLIRANLRLVVSIAKKYVKHPEAFYGLISDGNISLMKAIEKFDYTLGFKFSTYATWAIKNNYTRTCADEMKHLDRFRNSQSELLDYQPEHRSDPSQREHAQHQCESAVNKMLNCLDERERQIIGKRFGLNGYDRPHTLKEVGKDLGVSKERIRQLECRAISKLREAAADGNMKAIELVMP